MDYFYLVVLTLAAARAVHLIADDLFPFGWLRDYLNKKKGLRAYLGHGLSCTFCLSIWAGAGASGLALWQGWAPRDLWVFVILWFAIAWLTIFLESVNEALDGVAQR